MWVQLILFVISSVISYLLTPKPPNAKPGKVEIPTVEEGRKIGVLFGSRWIKGPHIFWWGDLATTPIKK
jgi:hypothetical protein